MSSLFLPRAICLDMEELVPVPAPVYKKSSNTQSVAEQYLPKYQTSLNSTYQIDSFKKEINKKINCQSRNLSIQRFILATNQALKFEDFIIGWCRNWTFMSNSAQYSRLTNADILDIFHST